MKKSMLNKLTTIFKGSKGTRLMQLYTHFKAPENTSVPWFQLKSRRCFRNHFCMRLTNTLMASL